MKRQSDKEYCYSSKNGATTLSRMNFSVYVERVTIFSWMFTTACWLAVRLGLGLDLMSGSLVVMHTYSCYFLLSLSLFRMKITHNLITTKHGSFTVINSWSGNKQHLCYGSSPQSLQCNWTSSLELSADGPQTARLVTQSFQTIAERKGKERKWTCIAPIVSISTTKRSDVDHTELPANTPHLPFLRISIR